MELREELEKLRDSLQQQAIERNEQCKILDIEYYKHITFDNVEGKEQPLYLVEKEVNGEIKRELQVGDTVIADIGEDNSISMRKEFAYKELDILIQLRDIEPISLNELERIEQRKQSMKNKEFNSKEESKSEEEVEQMKNTPLNYVAEIDMDKKITETKTFAELVPEAKEKQVEKVRVRRIDSTRFEIYGVGKAGEYIPLETLKQVEGTNPTKEINEINESGEKVEKNQVYSMFQLTHGTNEQNGNEGFTVDLEDGTGIPEIAYYRRSRDNEYTSIPVNLKNTNQKRTELEVREYAEKTRNPQVSDNIEKADNILEEQEETTLENIDDDLNNDTPETRREYEDKLIKEAAERCKMSEEGFREVLEQERKEGEPIEESIERAEDEVNEQVIGGRNR
ncbi:MAG: hypothetical protein J6A04_05710 [Clostridia bacterium]|nr:hypothetical protein [Clostridia bacterium]